MQRTLDILRCKESEGNKGTLWQLANITNNSHLKLDPVDEYQRVKHAFYLILRGYITAATLQHIGSSNPADADGFIPMEVCEGSNTEKCQWLLTICKDMVKRFCNIGLTTLHDNMQTFVVNLTEKHICTHCGKEYVYKKCFKKHLLKVHGEEMPLEEPAQEESDEIGDGVFNYICTAITTNQAITVCSFNTT